MPDLSLTTALLLILYGLLLGFGWSIGAWLWGLLIGLARRG